MLGLACLVLALGCAACATTPKQQDISGDWVVDVAASQKINSFLSKSDHTRQFMSAMVMGIDLRARELVISHPGSQPKVLQFDILLQEPAHLLLKITDGAENITMQLTLQGEHLTVKLPDTPSGREDFVFIRRR